MKRLLLPLCLAACCLAGGCASTVVCEAGGVSTINVFNTGWYLLNCIPLASGNPEAPNACDCRLFRQTTTLENNVKMLDAVAAEHGATGLKNVSTDTLDECVFIILFKRHIIHTSAEMILPPKEEPAS